MGNEYNDDRIVLRDTNGNQMSLARFFQLALDDGNGHKARPTQGPSSAYNPNHHAWDMGTQGVENVVPVRTPVAGTVITAAEGYNNGLGVHVVIQEQNGRKHEFLHMFTGSIQVAVGDNVEQGALLGRIGNTGDSDGPHLHYSIIENGSRIYDPIEAYDCTTLPTGWNMNDAAAALNWDYIQLDDTATNYGPPSGDAPAEPYYPTTPCYDIAHPQARQEGGTLNRVIDLIAATGSGGVIIQVGNFDNNQFRHETSFDPAEAVQHALDAGLGLGIYFYNYVSYSTDMTQAFQDSLTYLQTIGATADKVNLGVWLDMESGSSYDPPILDKATNRAYLQHFLDVYGPSDYPVAGVYSSAGILVSLFESSTMVDVPVWAAYWQFNFNAASRDSLNSWLDSNYNKVYLMQYSDNERVSGYDGPIDGDKVLMAMPVYGSSSGGGGEGSGDYTEVINVTVDVVPPKRIYFDPVPGLISPETDLISDREATVSITTDADSAILYYTVDGSSPYVYTTSGGNVVYTIAETAQLYSEPIVITRDSHIRVVAVPIETVPGDTFEKPLAKSSATYLFRYTPMVQDWDAETKSYAMSDGDVSFFEENRQAFLQLHAQLTDEEILYTEPYKHDIQSEAQNAEDNASTVDSTTPMVRSSGTNSEEDSDVSDS